MAGTGAQTRRPATVRPPRAARSRTVVVLSLVTALLVAGCGAVVSGTPQAAGGRTAGTAATAGTLAPPTRPSAATRATRPRPSTPVSSPAPSPTSSAAPTASTTARPTTARPTSARPTTARPTTARPTTARPTTARPTTARPTRPAGPTADPRTGKIYALADHPILQDPRAGLKNYVCSLPALQATTASLNRFYLSANRCLNRSWGTFLRAYDLPFVEPKLVFPTGKRFDTPCGVQTVGIALAAYYCENTLYLPPAGQQLDLYGADAGVYLALIAHEYGHHVQEVSGILDASWERIRAAGEDTPAGQQMSRRKELQAQCFSGMFVGSAVYAGGSVTRAMYARAWADQETRGDDTSGTTDHGTNAHYAQWWRAGAVDNRIVDCNTFAAPASAVS